MRNLIRPQFIWAAVLAILIFCPAAHVEALVVGSALAPPASTNVNPVNYDPLDGKPDWNSGDPGWNKVSIGGHHGVYLGNGWVISARHAGAPTGTQTITFDTLSGPVAYQTIPGQDFVVRNPRSTLAGGLNLLNLESGETDLRLYRLAGAPNISAPIIASRSQPVPAGGEVAFVSRGGTVRQSFSGETTWYVNTTAGPKDWSWSTTSGGHQKVFLAYPLDGTNLERRWGTNHLASTALSEYSEVFDSVLSDATGVVRLRTPDNKIRNVIVMATQFDRESQGGTAWESQAMVGDSGGAVFYNYGTPAAPQWKLAGIINFVKTYDHQPYTTIFGESGGAEVLEHTGNSTFFSDLSYYNQAYNRSICDIMKACTSDYSIPGDVNVDDKLDSDDIAALVAGWRNDNGAGVGDYLSWTKGDLTRDGKTDAADFFKLRQAFLANGSWTAEASALAASLFDGGAVPEPSTIALLLMTVGTYLSIARRRVSLRLASDDRPRSLPGSWVAVS